MQIMCGGEAMRKWENELLVFSFQGREGDVLRDALARGNEAESGKNRSYGTYKTYFFWPILASSSGNPAVHGSCFLGGRLF